MTAPRDLRPPRIMGLPTFEHPLLNPATGEPESVFDPKPGEVVPPADILAEIFPPRGEAGQSLPNTVEEVRVLADSIEAFYERATSNQRSQLDVYRHALQRKEDELDPPLNRYTRAFHAEMTSRIDGVEGFSELIATLFNDRPEGAGLSDEAYEQWHNLFAQKPHTIALFYLFTTTAERQGHIRKNWVVDQRSHTQQVLINRLYWIRNSVLNEAVIWFGDAVGGAEEVFDAAETATKDGNIDYAIEESRLRTYNVLANTGVSIFASGNKEHRQPKTYMRFYAYEAFQNFLEALQLRTRAAGHKTAMQQFSLDMNRLVVQDMLKQKIIKPAASGLVHAPTSNRFAMDTIEAAKSTEDGLVTTREEFDAILYQYLGLDFNPRNQLEDLQALLDRRTPHLHQ